jgi:hypothetical protein
MRDELRKAMEPIRTEVGSIVQLSQQLELGLKYSISLTMGLEGEQFSDAEFDAVYESLARSTLGPLIAKFRKHIELEEGVEDVLAKALKERNYVVHSFFYDRIESLASPEGRNAGLAYLRTAWRTIAAGVAAVDTIVPKLMLAAGIDSTVLSLAAKNAIKL